ncbi:tetratricopeptide repeat protein [bacterium]|nr:tetratricopeptide repeat protein [bacterium]
MKDKKEKFNKNEDNLEQELIELGKFYFLNQKYDQAIKEFQEALKINSNNPQIYYNLGITYEAKNMIEQASKMYRQTLELKSDHVYAKEHLDKLVGI